MKEFTNAELYTLSKSILNLMQDLQQAQRLTVSQTCSEAIDNDMAELQRLNIKVLEMVEQ